jgi:Fe-Mn family superoxide dismutase
MILHEIFFDGLGNKASRGRFFKACWHGLRLVWRAGTRNSSRWKGIGGGSGWVLSWSSRTASSSIVGIRSLSQARRRQSILALDMYEHSYHIDFGAKAAIYVDTS